uniref:Uncharacterized protein n=1 Tax=Ascaris lumbricoides TaxID=6252 RepID=A0A0M3HRJ3_ASCLU
MKRKYFTSKTFVYLIIAFLRVVSIKDLLFRTVAFKRRSTALGLTCRI